LEEQCGGEKMAGLLSLWHSAKEKLTGHLSTWQAADLIFILFISAHIYRPKNIFTTVD
jgi:hypothetical protein